MKISLSYPRHLRETSMRRKRLRKLCVMIRTSFEHLHDAILISKDEEKKKSKLRRTEINLTNLSPSCSTRQFRNAVWPTRVVTFRATEKSKYGCEEKFWLMLLLSRRLFVSKFLYAWYGSEAKEWQTRKIGLQHCIKR